MLDVVVERTVDLRIELDIRLVLNENSFEDEETLEDSTADLEVDDASFVGGDEDIFELDLREDAELDSTFEDVEGFTDDDADFEVEDADFEEDSDLTEDENLIDDETCELVVCTGLEVETFNVEDSEREEESKDEAFELG